MPTKAMLLSSVGSLARFSVVVCLIEHGGVSKGHRGDGDWYLMISDVVWWQGGTHIVDKRSHGLNSCVARSRRISAW